MSINIEDIKQLTEKLNNFNNTIDTTINSGLSQLVSIPDTALRNKKIQEFFDSHVSPKVQSELKNVKASAVSYLHGQYTQAIAVQALLGPIVNANFSDLGSVISWAKNVINYLAGPYGQAITTITETTKAVTDLATALNNTQSKIISYKNYLDPQLLMALGTSSLPSINIPTVSISLTEVISGEV